MKLRIIRVLGYFFILFLPLTLFAAGKSARVDNDEDASTHAADAHPNAFGLQVGQAWTSGNIGLNVDGAIAPGAFYEYAASDVFAMYTSVVRSSHDNGSLILTSTNLGFKANLVYYDKLVPYIDFGMGLYFIDKAYGRESAKKTLFGMNLGFGADLDLSDRLFAGMQLAVHQLFSGAVYLPEHGKVDLSGRWSGFFMRAGVRF